MTKDEKFSTMMEKEGGMRTKKIRALCKSADGSIDLAMNELVWAEHPVAIEALQDARQLIDTIMDQLGDEDGLDELDF